MELYFIRHGQSTANAEKRFSGWSDIPLTEKGVQQAVRTGEGLKGLKFDRIISSDTFRARQTAEAVFPGEAYTTDSRLRELHIGEELQDFLISDMYVKYGEALENAMEIRDFSMFGGESYDDHLKRVSEFIDELAEVPDHERIALVCHGGTVICMLSYLLQQKVDHHLLGLENASVSCFVRQDGKWRMTKWGQTY